MVQVLTDMNLMIRRAYISSDGEWFMDGETVGFNFPCSCSLACYCIINDRFSLQSSVTVFHVTDQKGNKLSNDDVVERIQQVDRLNYSTLQFCKFLFLQECFVKHCVEKMHDLYNNGDNLENDPSFQ